jgi:hypothetical protein
VDPFLERNWERFQLGKGVPISLEEGARVVMISEVPMEQRLAEQAGDINCKKAFQHKDLEAGSKR